MSPRPSPALAERLEDLLAQQDRAAHRAADPVSFVHRFADPGDQEVVGLLSASLAFGQVAAVRASIERVLVAVGPRPAEAVGTLGLRELRRRLTGFRHRVYGGDDVAELLGRAGALRAAEGSLGRAFERRLSAHGGLRPALADFAAELRGPTPSRGLAHLVSDPAKGSACKRMLLYLRWMIRPADGVDLGLWPVPASVLVMPLDTHVHRIARNLGLTARADASWRTAEEVTAALRRLDPDDPVRYDFALCHHGVSRDCPSRAVEAKCAACVLRPVCTQWRPARPARPA